MKTAFLFVAILALAGAVCAAPPSGDLPFSKEKVEAVFHGREGTLVIVDRAAGTSFRFHPEAAKENLPPCSTFKIWNTLIGLEEGVISSPGEPFYQWDGEVRFLPDWNKDLTLKEAFQVSCVPAFQALARKIGPRRMQAWIDKIGYGDCDTSAGIDCFWLPAAGRKTLLISPEEQAQAMARLTSGEVPFSEKSRKVLKEIMEAKRTGHGVLYGKTGTGLMGTEDALGWFVGYVESGGKSYAFACVLRGAKVTGKDARAAVETIFEQQSLL